VARRKHDIQRREKELLALVTEFHIADGQAEAVRTDAEAKAARLVRDAEAKAAAVREKAGTDAAKLEEEAAAVVRRMIAFGEPREAVVQLTGWSATRVREAQRSGDAPGTPAARPE